MIDKQKEYFSKLLDESFQKRKAIEPGARYIAVITSVKDDYVFIRTKNGSIGGIIPIEEFKMMEETPELKKELEAFFLYEESGDFYFTIGLEGATLDWDKFEMANEKGIPVVGQIRSEVNGGYDIKLGEYAGFCPYSQIDPELKEKQKIIGSTQRFIVTEVQHKINRLVVSQKKISDKQKELKREILKDKLEVGQFVTCSVKSVHNFGLIVDLNGLNALVPASEATFKRNPDLTKEFHIGQSLRGKIISLDWEANKVSVSVKETLENPWASSVPFKEGDIVSGTVESVKPFGLFVKLTDVFHALVPNKESGYGQRDPLTNHFKKGDPVEVFIMEVNPEKKQISASLQKAKETKERMEYQNYIKQQDETSSTSSFGNILKKSLGR